MKNRELKTHIYNDKNLHAKPFFCGHSDVIDINFTFGGNFVLEIIEK